MASEKKKEEQETMSLDALKPGETVGDFLQELRKTPQGIAILSAKNEEEFLKALDSSATTTTTTTTTTADNTLPKWKRELAFHQWLRLKQAQKGL
jgi:hypothetical protein